MVCCTSHLNVGYYGVHREDDELGTVDSTQKQFILTLSAALKVMACVR